MNLPLYLLAINVVTFALYGLDKRAARRQASRTPEAVLLMAGFVGGTLAAIVAQQWFRHKTRKGSFQFKFWAITLVQIGLLVFQPGPVGLILSKLF